MSNDATLGEGLAGAKRGEDRRRLAAAAGSALRARASEASAMRVVAGFDAMLDAICRAVDRRTSAGEFRPMERMEQFAGRVADNAGKSINIELFVERVKLGGNGALMADGLARLGARVRFVGAVGDGAGGVHELFVPFATRCEAVHPTSSPGFTDAVEFADGKVMLGKTVNLAEITWERVVSAMGGPAAVRGALDGAGLLIPVSWTMVPHMNALWEGFARGPLREIEPSRRPWVFIDLADPAKRPAAELAAALRALGELSALTKVALGVNLAESARVAAALGVPEPRTLEEGAREIRRELGLACVVGHRRDAAAAATATEEAAFDGPFVRKPRMSTGAGDHFNAGFSLGWRLGLGLEACLAVATAVSGLYVRTGEGPGLEEVAGFLERLPEPERG